MNRTVVMPGNWVTLVDLYVNQDPVTYAWLSLVWWSASGGGYDFAVNYCPPPCDKNIWGDWSSCTASCGSGNQVRINQCGFSEIQSCCIECGPTTGTWGNCALNPGPVATKTRPITYNCQANTTETVDCIGTIQARAVEIYSPTASCAVVRASTQGIDGAEHGFTLGSASQPTPLTQTQASYVTFPNVVGGYYSIDSTVPVEYVLNSACWNRTLNNPLSDTGVGPISLSVPQDTETLTWDLGYLLGIPWVQTGGGNVYAALGIKSYIAALSSPRVFSLNGPGGSPGVVRYGTTYDFDADPGPSSKGETLVSDPKWLAQETDAPTVNYYEYFWRKLGGMTTEDTTDTGGSAIDKNSMVKPQAGTYYLKGPVTTSSSGWSIGATEKTIIIIDDSTPGAGDASLAINGPITITPGGFVSFIVNGNITVDPSVGGPAASDTPVIEGIYITSPTGSFQSFQTGASSVAGAERFVGQGMFVAGGFLLQRDLGNGSDNTTTSSELFLYNPQLLFTMPDSMKDVPIKWEEVAP